MIEDIVINYYKNNGVFKNSFDFSFLKGVAAYNSNPGLGDSVLLTSVIKDITCFSPSRFWSDICSLINVNNKTPEENRKYFHIEQVIDLGSGNGHMINGIQRAFLGKTQVKPKGYLGSTKQTVKNKIGVCVTTGASYRELISRGYQNPRQIYNNTLNELQKFINTSSEYSFVELGKTSVLKNKNVRDMTGRSIKESLLELSTCEYFIGLNSGFMNAAAALDIKSIIIVNVPTVDKLYLPQLHTNLRIVDDLCWLYPQNVHLHQDGENELVPSATCDNMKKAINGEVYPFWKDNYLDLINYNFSKTTKDINIL